MSLTESPCFQVASSQAARPGFRRSRGFVGLPCPSSARLRALVSVSLLLVLALAWSPRVARADTAEPTLSEAEAATVVDSSGNVLFEKNPDEEINMASVTKVMTAVVALESGVSLGTQVTIQAATDLPENAMVAGYQPGQTSSLEDLMRVMLVRSANDAAYEVAVACAGSEQAFVDKMNDKAAELGMTHTHFVNPHGLDAEGHHSSVSDLVTLARYAMTRYPFISDTVRRTSVTVPIGSASITFPTVDTFLTSYQGALGIKTGTGDTVTSFLGAARRGGTTLYTCVLGCKTAQGRFSDTRALMDWAFTRYQRYQLSRAGQIVAVQPYAYHFGLSAVVSADTSTKGLVWPDGGATTYERTLRTSGVLSVPNEGVGVCQWTQDGRVVATVSYSTRPKLVRTPVGIGLFGRLDQLPANAGLANAAA